MKYTMPDLSKLPKLFRVKMDRAGRIVLPREVRKAMNIHGELTLQMDERGVHMQTMDQVIKGVQDYFCQFAPGPGEELVSEELIREHREEAARENAEAEAWLKKQRRKKLRRRKPHG